MKNCPTCGMQNNDTSMFCISCGASLAAAPAAPEAAPAAPAAPQAAPVTYQQPAGAPAYTPAPVVDQFDHTAEFDAKDISDNKPICIIIYLLGIFGILLAAILSKDSEYVKFHIRQALKIEACLVLTILFNIVPFIGWLAYAVCATILGVLKIIAFFSICKGNAKEIPIVRSLGFLK